jgi:hypothetical protein
MPLTGQLRGTQGVYIAGLSTPETAGKVQGTFWSMFALSGAVGFLLALVMLEV